MEIEIKIKFEVCGVERVISISSTADDSGAFSLADFVHDGGEVSTSAEIARMAAKIVILASDAAEARAAEAKP